MALGGLERARAELGRQFAPDVTPAAQVVRLCRLNATADQEGLFNNLTGDLQDNCSLSYTVQDEQGVFNINQPDTVAWANLKILSKENIACIIDWMDADDDINPGGGERDYYEHQDPPSVAKNSNIVALRELRLVKDIAFPLYVGADRSQNAVPGTNSSGTIPQLAGNANAKPGLIDCFTVYGDGKINVNTASASILAALPGYDDAAAQAILTYRAGPDGRLNTDDDVCIEPTDNLTSIPGVENRPPDYFGLTSEYFRVYSYATLSNGIGCSLMATMKRTGNDVKVLYVERLH